MNSFLFKLRKYYVKYESYAILFFLLLILILSIILRCPFLSKPFWYDELWRANNLSITPISESIINQDNAPVSVGIFLIIRLFIYLIGNSELAMRLPIFLFGLTIPVFVFLLVKTLTQKPYIALFASLIFSVFTPYVKFSYTLKPYVVEIFFTLLNIILFDRLWKKASYKNIIIFLITSIITIFFSLPTILLYPALLFMLCIKLYKKHNKQKNTLVFIQIILIVIISAIYYFFYLKPQTERYVYNFWSEYFYNPSSFVELVRFVIFGLYNIFNNFIFPYSPTIFIGSWLMPAMFFISSISGIVFLWVRKKYYYIFLILSGLLNTFILSVFHVWPYGPVRVNLFLFSLITILVAIGITELGVLLKHKGIIIKLLIFLLILITFPYNKIKNDYNSKDDKFLRYMSGSKEAIMCINRNIRNNDSVVIYHHMLREGFEYYYNHNQETKNNSLGVKIYFDNKNATSNRDENFFVNNLKNKKRLWILTIKGLQKEDVKNIYRLANNYGQVDNNIECDKFNNITVRLYNGSSN